MIKKIPSKTNNKRKRRISKGKENKIFIRTLEIGKTTLVNNRLSFEKTYRIRKISFIAHILLVC